MGLVKVGLGIDVGGTFTDAVLIDLETRDVLSSAKSRTTNQDLSLGIAKALGKLEGSLIPRIDLVALSTTLATNAIVQGTRSPIASILIGYREEHCPPEFRRDAFLVRGGHDVTGKEKASLDETEILKIIEGTQDHVQAYAVAGYFSSRNPDHESRVKRLIQEETEIPVICGHELSLKLDAIVRATTTTLNAHLIPVIKELLTSVRGVFNTLGVAAPLMVVKGDGSLISEEVALERPIETVLSGPAASVIGAKHLRGSIAKTGAIVVDVGGTTSDIAVLQDGRPVINPTGVRIGQWQTSVAAIDTLTIGLGGDSQILCNDRGRLTIGPQRVIPLAILAYQFQEVAQELARMAEGFIQSTGYSQVDHWITYKKAENKSLAGDQRRLLSLVQGHPQSTLQLAQTLDLHPTLVLEKLRPLVESGLVLCAGFTPTDIFHLRAVYSKGNREAAKHAASILARQMNLDVEQLCHSVGELFNLKLGLGILQKVSTDNHDYYGGVTSCSSCQAIWENCFAGATDTDGRKPKKPFSLQIKLKDPIIGLGAPAQTVMPPLAERLGTQCVVPPHAEVANALGAISGVVMATGEVTLVPDESGRARLFSQDGRAVYATLEKADKEAKRLLRERLFEEAKRTGANNVEVKLEEHEKRARTGFGDVLIEKVIRGRAIGTPGMNDIHGG
jgi:N-methylhydantoinase A/oxoprolinase/acetone carboxylase beta subunit